MALSCSSCIWYRPAYNFCGLIRKSYWQWTMVLGLGRSLLHPFYYSPSLHLALGRLILSLALDRVWICVWVVNRSALSFSSSMSSICSSCDISPWGLYRQTMGRLSFVDDMSKSELQTPLEFARCSRDSWLTVIVAQRFQFTNFPIVRWIQWNPRVCSRSARNGVLRYHL